MNKLSGQCPLCATVVVVLLGPGKTECEDGVNSVTCPGCYMKTDSEIQLVPDEEGTNEKT